MPCGSWAEGVVVGWTGALALTVGVPATALGEPTAAAVVVGRTFACGVREDDGRGVLVTDGRTVGVRVGRVLGRGVGCPVGRDVGVAVGVRLGVGGVSVGPVVGIVGDGTVGADPGGVHDCVGPGFGVGELVGVGVGCGLREGQDVRVALGVGLGRLEWDGLAVGVGE